MRSTHVAIAVALVTGCQSAHSDEGRSEPVSSEQDVTLRYHMDRNYDLSRAIERLLISGDLDGAKALARSLASAPSTLDVWGPQTALVQQRATALANAPGLDEACRRAAQVSEACAECHVKTRAPVAFSTYPAAPEDQPTLDARMARHRWAVDRLWEGMISNADKPWRDGLAVLAATPPPFSPAAGDRPALAKRLEELALEASVVRGMTLPDRAQRYGEILVVCAACHSGSSTTPH